MLTGRTPNQNYSSVAKTTIHDRKRAFWPDLSHLVPDCTCVIRVTATGRGSAPRQPRLVLREDFLVVASSQDFPCSHALLHGDTATRRMRVSSVPPDRVLGSRVLAHQWWNSVCGSSGGQDVPDDLQLKFLPQTRLTCGSSPVLPCVGNLHWASNLIQVPSQLQLLPNLRHVCYPLKHIRLTNLADSPGTRTITNLAILQTTAVLIVCVPNLVSRSATPDLVKRRDSSNPG